MKKNGMKNSTDSAPGLARGSAWLCFAAQARRLRPPAFMGQRSRLAWGVAVGLAAWCGGGPAWADEVIIPNHAPTTAGPGAYTTILHQQPRSYQLVVGPVQLSGLPVGSRITGITWRRPTWTLSPDWPGVGVTRTFAAFDITLSRSLNPPGSLSSTYTENIGPDAVVVRSGGISFTGAFFPGGALTPAVNPFGEVIAFTTPYEYKGGDLLLTVRHTGHGGASAGLDTVSGAGTQAIGVSSYTQPDAWYAQGLITMKLVFTPPAACCVDYNGDEEIDFTDVEGFLAAYVAQTPGACAPGADLNGDEEFDFSDVERFLALYNAGC